MVKKKMIVKTIHNLTYIGEQVCNVMSEKGIAVKCAANSETIVFVPEDEIQGIICNREWLMNRSEGNVS